MIGFQQICVIVLLAGSCQLTLAQSSSESETEIQSGMEPGIQRLSIEKLEAFFLKSDHVIFLPTHLKNGQVLSTIPAHLLEIPEKSKVTLNLPPEALKWFSINCNSQLLATNVSGLRAKLKTVKENRLQVQCTIQSARQSREFSIGVFGLEPQEYLPAGLNYISEWYRRECTRIDVEKNVLREKNMLFPMLLDELVGEQIEHMLKRRSEFEKWEATLHRIRRQAQGDNEKLSVLFIDSFAQFQNRLSLQPYSRFKNIEREKSRR